VIRTPNGIQLTRFDPDFAKVIKWLSQIIFNRYDFGIVMYENFD
jgi:hypothetical protein